MLLQQRHTSRASYSVCHAKPAGGGRSPLPPLPAEIPDPVHLHGDLRLRQFSWLKDPTRRKANVLHYLKSEDTYCKKVLALLGADHLLKQLLPPVEASHNAHLWQEVQRTQIISHDRTWMVPASTSWGCHHLVTVSESQDSVAGMSGRMVHWRHSTDSMQGSSNATPQRVMLLDESSMQQCIPGFCLLDFLPSPDFAFVAYIYSSTVTTTATSTYLLLQILDAASGVPVGAPHPVSDTREACKFLWCPDHSTFMFVDSSGKSLLQTSQNSGWIPTVMYRDPGGHGLQLARQQLQPGTVIFLHLMSPGGWCVNSLMLLSNLAPTGVAVPVRGDQSDLKWLEVLPQAMRGHFTVHPIKNEGLLFCCHDRCLPPRCSLHFWNAAAVHATLTDAADNAFSTPHAACDLPHSQPLKSTVAVPGEGVILAGQLSNAAYISPAVDPSSFQLLLQTEPGMVIAKAIFVDDRPETQLLLLLTRVPTPLDKEEAPQQLLLQHLEIQVRHQTPLAAGSITAVHHHILPPADGVTATSSACVSIPVTSSSLVHISERASTDRQASAVCNPHSDVVSLDPVVLGNQEYTVSCSEVVQAQLTCVHSHSFTLPLPFHHISDMVWLNAPSRQRLPPQGQALHTTADCCATPVHRPSSTTSLQTFAHPMVQLHYSSTLHSERSMVLDMSKPQASPPGVEPAHQEHLAFCWLWATASDGTQVPISIVYDRRRVQLGVKPAPLLLVCYGAYGATESMTFNPSTLHWLERGWIRASVHSRGGGLLGPAWHAGGRQGNRSVATGDVISCAEHLIASGMTSKELLCAEAISAGGWLLGAAMNRAPQLFRAAVLTVPSLDVLQVMVEDEYMVHELGDPHDREEYFAAKAWSPAENVDKWQQATSMQGLTTACSPDVLVRVALYDQDVPFWDPATYVAMYRVRCAKKQATMTTTVGDHHQQQQQQESRAMASLGPGLLLMQVSLGNHQAYSTAQGDAGKMAFFSACLGLAA